MATGGEPLSGPELAAFVAAFEAASLHGAADALTLTQSAVTKRLQSLERRLGGRLFERGRFGVRPTAFGQALYPSARHALDALDAVADAAEAALAHGASELRLAASLTVGEFLLPGWLWPSAAPIHAYGRSWRSSTRPPCSRRSATIAATSDSSKGSIRCAGSTRSPSRATRSWSPCTSRIPGRGGGA